MPPFLFNSPAWWSLIGLSWRRAYFMLSAGCQAYISSMEPPSKILHKFQILQNALSKFYVMGSHHKVCAVTVNMVTNWACKQGKCWIFSALWANSKESTLKSLREHERSLNLLFIFCSNATFRLYGRSMFTLLVSLPISIRIISISLEPRSAYFLFILNWSLRTFSIIAVMLSPDL